MATVIAKSADKTYIMEVQHQELEKFMGLYYDNMQVMKVGESVDLGAGHDHSREIKEALQKTQAFIEANAKTINAINKGLLVMRNIPKSAIAKLDKK